MCLCYVDEVGVWEVCVLYKINEYIWFKVFVINLFSVFKL